jgi:hypothetical protein
MIELLGEKPRVNHLKELPHKIVLCARKTFFEFLKRLSYSQSPFLARNFGEKV